MAETQGNPKNKKVRLDQHRAEKRKRKAASRNKAADYCVYLVARLGIVILRIIGLRMSYLLGRLAGSAIYYLSSKRRFYALGHLKKSFPEWDEKKRRRVARLSLQNITCMGIELLLTPYFLSIENITQHIQFTNFQQVLRTLITRKTPIIMVTGHFGNWELAGYASSLIDLPTNTVARRLDNPYINGLIFSVRERAGQKMIYKDGASQEISKALTNHEPVSLVGDQDAGQKGMYVDFFGRQASTYKSIGLMAMQFDTPIATVFCRRIGWKFKFELFVGDVITPDQWKQQDDPLRYITERFTKSIEDAVRKAPEQYFWIHRRWKHRPKGEQRGPHGVF